MCGDLLVSVFLLMQEMQTELSGWAHKFARVLESTWKFSEQNIYLQYFRIKQKQPLTEVITAFQKIFLQVFTN